MIAPAKDIVLAHKESDQSTRVGSGTSYSSPIVAGVLAIYVGWEKIQSDTPKVVQRMGSNALLTVVDNIPDTSTANRFIASGIHNDFKEDGVPYFGAPKNMVQDAGETLPTIKASEYRVSCKLLRE